MRVNIIDKDQFNDYVYKNSLDFIDKIKTPEIFIVKNYYSKEFCNELREKSFQWGQTSESSWHPFYDDCPDYHRLHDNYPKAYVKQKFHGFYRHKYHKINAELFEKMKDIFLVKNHLSGSSDLQYYDNIPSDGILPRINLHHYPKGGGYQAEHIDPDGPFAQIQTLIIASEFGVDFKVGGVYARSEIGGEKIYVDSYLDIGDLLVLSPAIPHGVDPIDPDEEYLVNENSGRWVILPLFLYSDYANENNIKPKQIEEK